MALAYEDDMITDIRRRLDRPVVLIGLMGVGKTRLGRMLATTLDLPFVDSDEEIEKAAGMDISDIFERYGEAHFRDGEHRVIKRLLEGPLRVIATGGGAIMTPKTAELMWEKTLTIWIKADIDVMVERTSRTDKRPLLQSGDSKTILGELADKRYPIYEKADIMVESHNGPAKSILEPTLNAIDSYLRLR